MRISRCIEVRVAFVSMGGELTRVERCSDNERREIERLLRGSKPLCERIRENSEDGAARGGKKEIGRTSRVA